MGKPEIDVVSIDNIEVTCDGVIVTSTVDWLGSETQVESKMDQKVFMDAARESMFMWV